MPIFVQIFSSRFFATGWPVTQAVEATGLSGTQQLATLLDGLSRHTPEGHNFKKRVEEQGWKQAVQERDKGTFDWSKNKPIQE